MSNISATSSQATPTHEIKVRLQGTEAVPDPIPEMKIGETVRYVSDDGEVEIAFPGRSPFSRNDELNSRVRGGVILELVNESTGLPNNAFVCRCFLTLPDRQVVGWKSDPSISGGEHRVGRP